MKSLLLLVIFPTVALADFYPMPNGGCVITPRGTVCTPPTPKPTTNVFCYCEYDFHGDGPMSKMKSYGLIRVLETQDGKEKKTLIKTFYDLKEDKCNKAAETLNACKAGL